MEGNYDNFGYREKIMITDKVYSNGSKILARRGREDRPQTYEAQEKVRILNDRRKVKKNLRDFI
jgi:hypothetical protein